jgi:predicted methyltransferase
LDGVAPNVSAIGTVIVTRSLRRACRTLGHVDAAGPGRLAWPEFFRAADIGSVPALLEYCAPNPGRRPGTVQKREICMINHRYFGALALILASCSQQAAPPPETPAGASASAGPAASARLDEVLAAQSEETKSRYAARHPKEMLEFFGVEPGMTVVDTLPGPVWYTGILLEYLGPSGTVIDADYSPEMWTHFGPFTPDPKQKESWVQDTVAKLEATRNPQAAKVAAFQYGSVPADMAGTVDVVLVVRALHHWMRLEPTGGYLTKALADIQQLLKPGGVVGVEQHRAPESHSDASANGDRGYIKQSAVITAFKQAGFELVEQSEINNNPKDQPSETDVVWRLPPTLATSKDNPELKAQMEAIGETDRMTLKFRKPS